MSEMVERVARAFDAAREECITGARANDSITLAEMERIYARAAIAAMREPTEAMVEAGGHEAYRDWTKIAELEAEEGYDPEEGPTDTWPDCWTHPGADDYRSGARAGFSAMIDVALQPEQTGEGRVSAHGRILIEVIAGWLITSAALALAMAFLKGRNPKAEIAYVPLGMALLWPILVVCFITSIPFEAAEWIGRKSRSEQADD